MIKIGSLKAMETGQNSNGRYIKFYNGVMWAFNMVDNHDFGTTFPAPVSFPVSFYEGPVVAHTNPRSSYFSPMGQSGTQPTTTGFNAYSTSDSGVYATNVTDLHWVAMGKWKKLKA